MARFKFTISLLKESFSEFSNDNVLKLSAALSYYTIFSLAPMLLLIISFVSIFFGREAFEGELFGQLRGLLGTQAAAQVQELIKNAALKDKSTMAAVVGGVTLLVGATGVFAEIQDSINYIWSIKSKPRKGWLQYLKNRLLSFSIIVTLGFLLVVSLGVNTAVDLLSERLERYFSEVSVIIFSVLNVVLVQVIIAALFAVVFKVLPDGHVRWKECLIGAGFTSVLFAIGKFAITFYLGSADLGATYGTSASIVILLTWIYYSSIILYFGAEFTKVYAKADGHQITPNEHAVLMERREVQQVDGSKLAAKEKFADVNPVVISSNLLHRFTDFIDEKIDGIRSEIDTRISKAVTPVVYYLLLGILAFVALVTLLIVVGQLLNLWLDSYYLGYLILVVFMILMIAANLLLRQASLRLISKLLFRLTKSKGE